ncbi:ABC transporter ATP-binding protein [Nonomuraea sp. SYSU D8015]|uniref:ABC transporter ATP-binding protein n=1 Tax=Nonomuraea sp. SYSU D8015 TaxID=2593644 RepID=UPI001CB6DEC2|nr:ABC transporter ATP-binding protein [Nonomuraea sp. SYSU D8015]
MPLLEVTGLRKSYGEHIAVDDVSFAIGVAETYGLLGPNGAGKTTSISMIVGILDRDAGEVVIAGQPHDVTSVKTKELIGYVPQEIALYRDLSARENLRFFARLYGLGGRALKTRIEEILEVVGLSDRADERVEGFSGGMARRLNIGVGLMNRPKLLVLDEPTAGVDPQSRNAILESVERLADEGVAVLYTTHYMEEAERLCDRVGIIDQGRLRVEGTRRELVGLVGETDRVTLQADGDLARAVRDLAELSQLKQVSSGEGQIEVLVSDARALLPLILETVAGSGVQVRTVQVHEPDLESVFLHLTGKALRD